MKQIVAEKTELIDKVGQLQRSLADMTAKCNDLEAQVLTERCKAQSFEADLGSANMELEAIKAGQGDITQL